MKVYNILNLYACLGGNRLKWDEVAKAAGIKLNVVAVENDPELARLYKERFPGDKVVIADAHEYLLNHYKEFDFIWSSPPCPTHSKARFARASTTSPKFPDMKLYEEIIFLQKWFKGDYVVENVVPYYEPLIPAQRRGRHLYWTNITLPESLNERKGGIMEGVNEVNRWCIFHDYDFKKYKGKQRRDKIARNLVDYEVGKTILKTVLQSKNKEALHENEVENQVSIFDFIEE